MQKLQDLICGGPWGGNDNVCLVYWSPNPANPNDGKWIAWEDKPAPKADPLPEAGVDIAP